MSRAVILEEKLPAKGIDAIFEAFNNLDTVIPKGGTVAVLFDFLVPEGTPTTVNPETLGAIIKKIKQIPTTKIYVIPITMKKIDSIHGIRILGLENYLKSFGVDILNFSSFNQALFNPLPSGSISNENQTGEGIQQASNATPVAERIATPISQIDCVIVLSQLKSEPLWQIFTPLRMLSQTISTDNIKSDQNDGDFTFQVQETLNYIKKYNSIFVIADACHFLEGNGPFIQTGSKSKTLHRLFAADDLIALEWAIFSHFRLSPESNKFLKYAINQGMIEKTGSNVEIITPTPVNNPENICWAEMDPHNIKIEGLNLHIGEINEPTKYSFLQVLYNLQGLLYKDALNLGSWAILVGKNPPEPKDDRFIILFGDDAIQTTEKYEFRTIVQKKDILSGDDLEREIYYLQAKIREKIDKAQINYQIILEDNIQSKEDELDRELTTLEESMKLDLKMNKFQEKIQKVPVSVRSKYKVREIQNRTPKVLLNTNILSIAGLPPKPWDSIRLLSSFWDLYTAPLLHLFIDTTKHYYNYPEYDPKARKIMWKTLEKALKADLKTLYAPLLPENKREIKQVKREEKDEIKKISLDFKDQRKKIKETYKSKMVPVKDKIKEANLKKKEEKKK